MAFAYNTILFTIISIFLVIIVLFKIGAERSFYFKLVQNRAEYNKAELFNKKYKVYGQCPRILKFDEAVKYVRKRLMECIYNDMSAHSDDLRFMRHLASCVMKHVPVNIQDFRVYDRVSENGLTVKERKWFLPFIPSSPNASCIWLTVGIGGNSSQEEKLAFNEYKFCKFYGIEALENNYGDYATFGTIIPHAVGTEDSVHLTTIIPCNITGCVHKTQKLEIVAMHKLLDKYVGSRNIHFASFDIEGMEKMLIDGLMYNANITKNGVTFCQIDWELHADLFYQWIGIKANRIETVINLIKHSPYLPILISPVNKFYDYHHITLLHVENPTCIGPFKLDIIFNNRSLC